MHQEPDESLRERKVVVPGYEVLEELGRGGMGVVYKAHHRMMKRLVALKVIRGQRPGHPEAGPRFLREIQSVAKLNHPNVVLAYDAGEVDGDLFLVMEYVEGTDLHRLVLSRGPLPIAQACGCVRQAALGLQHARERGLVHRDVKPANLLLTRSGVVKVSDFGLAHLRAGAAGEQQTPPLTGDNAILGTLDFMAPEQALDPRRADCRADLYSAGCTLYFLLTGRVPFPAAGVAKVAAHLTQPPEPVEKFRPEVPPALARAVHRLLAKQPEQRYQTPAELAEALAPFAEVLPAALGTTVSAPPGEATLWSSAGKEPRRRLRRLPLIVGGLSCLLALGCGLMVWKFWPATRGTPGASPPGEEKRPATEAEARTALKARGATLEPDRPGVRVTKVRLAGPGVTDETLKYLEALRGLEGLAFEPDAIHLTNAGLASLKGLTGLRHLDLANLPWLRDAGLKHLAGLTNLEGLHLHKTAIGDKGLAYLKNLSQLNTLYLNDTRVTDAGLVHLHGLRNLNYLNLKGLRLSEQALQELRRALPEATIESP